MTNKNVILVIFLSWFFCLSLNLLSHNGLIFAFYNSLIYAFTLILVARNKQEVSKISLAVIFLLPFVPLYRFVPANPIVYFYLFFGLSLMFIATKIRKAGYFFVLIGLVAILESALISNGVFVSSFIPSSERLIWSNSETNRLIAEHKRDAVFIFYRLRPVFFNKGAYAYTFFSKISELFTLRNIQDTLLIANLYPLAYGLHISFLKRKRLLNKAVLMGFAVTLFASGINKSPDKFNSLFVAAPFIGYLIALGFSRVDKKLYTMIFVISIILANALAL